MVSASGVSSSHKKKTFSKPKESKPRILSCNPKEHSDGLKFVLQEKKGGYNFNISNEETIAIFDQFLEYQCISTKQHIFSLLKGLNEMKTIK